MPLTRSVPGPFKRRFIERKERMAPLDLIPLGLDRWCRDVETTARRRGIDEQPLNA